MIYHSDFAVLSPSLTISECCGVVAGEGPYDGGSHDCAKSSSLLIESEFPGYLTVRAELELHWTCAA